MEERQVSVDGKPMPLPDPFVVIATQNPVEYEGTYPLPEAQLDRFLLKLTVPLPEREDEIAVLARHHSGFNPRNLAAAGVTAVAGKAELEAGRAAVRRVSVRPEVLAYIVDVCRATRSSPSLSLGASPRGATAMLNTAKAWAWLSGRDFVTPDDVKALARPTLRHRIALRPEAQIEGVTPDGVLDGVLATVPVPRADRCSSPAGPRCSPRSPWRWPSPGPTAEPPSAWLTLGLIVLIAVDTLLAGATGALRFARIGDDQRPARRAHRHRPAGHQHRSPHGARRRSATPGRRAPASTPASYTVIVPAGERRRLDGVLVSTRRGERLADRVTTRSVGPFGLAGRQAWQSVPGRVTVLRPSAAGLSCRSDWPGCASSTASWPRACVARAPSSTLCASTCRATTSARSTGGPRPAAAPWPYAPGDLSGTAGSSSCSTPAACPRGGWATCRDSTPPSTRPCC